MRIRSLQDARHFTVSAENAGKGILPVQATEGKDLRIQLNYAKFPERQLAS